MLNRFGARRLIAAITLVWGIFACLMATVWNEASFYVVRLLLGAAESAFFPGMILYISLWFPGAYRGRVIALFMVASPISNALLLPLSAFLLKLDGLLGMSGWQYIFIGEGVPAILLAGAAYLFLSDRPSDATWLAPEEREWLVRTMEVDARARPVAQKGNSAWSGLTNPTVLVLAFGYFCIMMGQYGYNLWLPQIVKKFGLSLTQTGFVSALPYIAAAIFMLYWGRRLDRTGDKGWHAGVAAFLGCVGLLVSALVDTSYLAMAGLIVACMGVTSAMPTFWTIPTSLFTGTSAAASIALVSAVGLLGGFAGPYLMGVLRETTGSFSVGLIGLAIPLLFAGLMALAFRVAPQGEQSPQEASAT
jgi:MFS transporter, ACS family, tartrate transporter